MHLKQIFSIHITLTIRNQLTRNLQAKMSDIVDELNAGFADEFDRVITDGIDTSCITNK